MSAVRPTLTCTLCGGRGTTVCASCNGAVGGQCWRCHGSGWESCPRCGGKGVEGGRAGVRSPAPEEVFSVALGRVYVHPAHSANAFYVAGAPPAVYFCERYVPGRSENRPEEWEFVCTEATLPFVDWTSPQRANGNLVPATFFRGTGTLSAAWV
jgi:hypothetical protein